MEEIKLGPKEQNQIRVLTRLVAGKITTTEAAASLGKSVRWVEWKRPLFKRLGVAGLVHGNRNRRPWNRITTELRKHVQDLYRGKYFGFNFLHFTEKLDEEEGIHISPNSTRRILLEGQIVPPRQRRRSLHRKRRDRCKQEGEMLQLDGSPDDWLEGRGPWLCLINFIDDATGTKWREFREAEDLEGYMRVMKNVVEECGVPLSIYTDRTVIVAGASQKYKPFPDEPPGPSQFGRACQELGIAIILANSAPAKGRIERTHGTDQDRLKSELRLAGAKTLDEANSVLRRYDGKYGDRFTVAAANPEPAWRPRPETNLDDIFCIKEERVVANDNTVKVYGQIIDIPPGPKRSSYAGKRVMVHRRYDLTVGVFLDGQQIGGEKPSPKLRALGRATVRAAKAARKVYIKKPDRKNR